MLPLIISIIKALHRAARRIGHNIAIAADVMQEASRLREAAHRKHPHIE